MILPITIVLAAVLIATICAFDKVLKESRKKEEAAKERIYEVDRERWRNREKFDNQVRLVEALRKAAHDAGFVFKLDADGQMAEMLELEGEAAKFVLPKFKGFILEKKAENKNKKTDDRKSKKA